MSNVTGRTAPACWMTSILTCCLSACCLSAVCLSAGCTQDVPPTTSIAPATKRAADTVSAEIVPEPIDLPSIASTASDSEAPSVAKPKVIPLGPELPAVSPVKPVVVLSAAHAETCLVNVGDPMPSMTLEDVEGAEQTLSDLYGEKLTVVVFWAEKPEFAREEFLGLGPEVFDPYGPVGVNVVTINEGDAADRVKQLVEEAKVAYPVLIDEDGAAFAMVATETLPRTYLLDAEGKILWLDLEYSRSTRRELRNAIAYFLAELGS